MLDRVASYIRFLTRPPPTCVMGPEHSIVRDVQAMLDPTTPEREIIMDDVFAFILRGFKATWTPFA